MGNGLGEGEWYQVTYRYRIACGRRWRTASHTNRQTTMIDLSTDSSLHVVNMASFCRRWEDQGECHTTMVVGWIAEECPRSRNRCPGRYCRNRNHSSLPNHSQTNGFLSFSQCMCFILRGSLWLTPTLVRGSSDDQGPRIKSLHSRNSADRLMLVRKCPKSVSVGLNVLGNQPR